MPDLAPARAAPCRRDARVRREREQLVERRQRARSRLTITHGASAPVAPSGRPRIARRWFSNWLVSAPSIVQWRRVVDTRRELVREQPPADLEELDREHADVSSASMSAAQIASASRCGASRSWRAGDAEDPVAVDVLADRPERVSPSRPRTPTIESSRSKRTSSSASSSVAERPGDRRRDAAPSRRSRDGGSSRAPEDPSPRACRSGRSGSRASGRAPSRAGDPAPARVRATAGTAPTRAAASTGTFSNSYVTTSAPWASRASASSSSNAPTTSSPTSRAHASGDGSRNRNESPSGSPASPSMRPSWPPPMQATSVTGGDEDFVVNHHSSQRRWRLDNAW